MQMLDAAIAYAGQGLHVFALAPREKVPVTPRGCKDATTDAAAIRAMWADPSRNVAIATGPSSNVFVLDIDGDQGASSLRALEGLPEHGPLPATPEVVTARGRHIYLRYPGDQVAFGNSAGKLADGIDVRTEGGYVVAPPSVHPTGDRYRWADGKSPADVAFAFAPDWLLQRLTERDRKRESFDSVGSVLGSLRDKVGTYSFHIIHTPYGTRALEEECADLARTHEGQRNDRLNAVAFRVGQLIAAGHLRQADAVRDVLAAAKACGLGDREASRTVSSGIAAGLAKPNPGDPKPDLSIPENTRQNRQNSAENDNRHIASDDNLSVDSVSDAQEQTHTEWSEPLWFAEFGALDQFPTSALPLWLRQWAEQEAAATQTPPDATALVALAVVAAAVSKRAVINPRDSWLEPLNLYAAIVLPPGNRKSAVFRDAVAPLEAFELEQQAEYEEMARGAKSRARVAAEALRAKERQAARTHGKYDQRLPGGLDEALDAQAEADAEVQPMPRVVCGDTTPERLARLLHENGGKMALMDAEGSGPFGVMLGRYSDKGPNLAVYLSSHTGDTLRVDRVGSDPIIVRDPALTMAVMIQPEVLRRLGQAHEARGLGLVARILWCVPESLVGRRVARPPAMQRHVADQYRANVLAMLEYPEAGEAKVLRCSREADDLLVGLFEEIEPRRGERGDLYQISDWVNKLEGAVARIAGVLHCSTTISNPWSVEVSAETMANAIRIGRYLLSHATAALRMMGVDELMENAKRVLEWAVTDGLATFSKRDAHRGLASRFKQSNDLDHPIDLLVDRGFIRQVHVQAKERGRKPSPTYEINPAVYAAKGKR